MDLSALRQQVLFQTGGDAEDVQDYLPHLTQYLNEGYDRLLMAACGRHVGEGAEEDPPLSHDRSTPNLPAWTHRAIADWATWLICRNGNAQRQSRGYAFRRAFEEVESRLRSARSGRFIIHIPN